jgi:hypothetical protein
MIICGFLNVVSLGRTGGMRERELLHSLLFLSVFESLDDPEMIGYCLHVCTFV